MGYHLPFFPMHAAETLSDGRFQVWTLEERGAWVTLICHNWNDGDLPSAPSDLARLLHVSTTEAAQIMSAIGDRFVPVPGKPGRMWSPRLERERDRATTISRKRAEVGKKGAESRWHRPGNGNGMPLPSHEVAKPEAMEAACQIQSQSQSQSQEAASAAPETVKPIAVHLQAQCPDLAAALQRTALSVEVGRKATLWGEAEAIAKQVGVEAVLSCWTLAAAKRGGEDAVPLAYLIHPMRDLTRRGAPSSRGPQPVSQDFSESLDDVARRLEGKHGRPA